jgi:nucleoside-diphosphate-sugar epimerase
MNKNILITGGTGYLGSHILEVLVRKGYSVVLLKRRSSSLERIASFLTLITCYNVDDVSFDKIIQKHQIGAVIHTAASYGRNGESFTDLIAANILFPTKLLESAIKAGVKIFINTDTALPKSVNYYALSKGQFRDWLRKSEDKIDIINMVPEYFYGPGDDEWKLVTMIISKLVRIEPVIQFTDGLQQRDFVYIDDVVNAYTTVLEHTKKLKGWNEFFISSGRTISIREMAKICKEMCNNTTTYLDFGAIPNRQNDVLQSKGDNTSLRNLGWNAKIDLRTGISITKEAQSTIK